MTVEIVEELIFDEADVDWDPPMPPTDLIFDDGEPLESNRHRVAMNVLIRSMLTARAGRTDYFTGGNMFIYFSSEQVRNRDFRGPDFFVVLDVEGTRERQGWVVWEENGRYPDVIVELMSPSTAALDVGLKKRIYEQTFRTPDYFVYNPFEVNSLQGWHLHPHQGYQPLAPNDRGWLWCERLQLWLGVWEGAIDGCEAVWLRFYDGEGNLVLLPEELAERQRQETQETLQETQQALQQAIAKLREMGLSAEQVAATLGLPLEAMEKEGF